MACLNGCLSFFYMQENVLPVDSLDQEKGKKVHLIGLSVFWISMKPSYFLSNLMEPTQNQPE